MVLPFPSCLVVFNETDFDEDKADFGEWWWDLSEEIPPPFSAT
jgi:hypothetical protein